MGNNRFSSTQGKPGFVCFYLCVQFAVPAYFPLAVEGRVYDSLVLFVVAV